MLIYGVFVVCVDVDGKYYNGVVNIGICFIVNGVRN